MIVCISNALGTLIPQEHKCLQRLWSRFVSTLLGRQRQVWFIPLADIRGCTRGVQVKL